MQQRRSLWWVIALLAIAIGAGVWAWTGNRTNTNTNSTAENTNVAAQNTNAAAVTSYTYKGEDGKNALEILKAKYPKTTMKGSSLGDYVTGIDGHESGSNAYWEFFVNGKSSAVGPGSYTTKSTDTIEWKLTSF